MESGALETSAAPAPAVQPVTMACLRRQAWAKSRDSTWQESKPDPQSSLESQQSFSNNDTTKATQEPGQVPNQITNWLIECRTPIGASLDDQSPSASKGAPRNGCSFEDDLSLGAEANHVQSESSKSESCFSLAANQKRSQFKEKGRSMNSTGSGKSSTVSSVSELLDLYEEDPEEILLNLGFGREEPDLNAKIPSRFFNSSSSARGIDIKVYLRAQLQRMELENPSYALTSRFRQIEVLTTVANEFFQLYSQVSGQPLQRISSNDKEETVEAGISEEQPPALKKTNSARNVAKILKRTITKHNLLAASSESSEGSPQLNGNAKTDGEQQLVTLEQGGCNTSTDHKAEAVGQKAIRKKDSCSLATVTEETGGDGETESKAHKSPQEDNGVQDQLHPAELQSSSQGAEQEEAQGLQAEKSQTSTPEKLPAILAPPKLAQLRTENANSFDMEEIQSNEDENLPPRMSRATDLLRTVSQQSDSSGFAEDPSADSFSYLKVQESSDSCDSETTVTSHPSQDLATPIALKQPTFDLPEVRQEDGTTETDGRSGSLEVEDLEQIPEYAAHHLPKLRPLAAQPDERLTQDLEAEPQPTDSVSAVEEETQLELKDAQTCAISEQDPENPPNLTETQPDSTVPTETDGAEDTFQEEPLFFDRSGLASPPVPCLQVINALNRAKQYKPKEVGQGQDLQETSPSCGRGRSRLRRMHLQRSSSLPSSFVSPSMIVSSVKIHVGRGKMSCSQPRYSVKHNQEDKDGMDEQHEQEEEQTNILSTLIINPSSSAANKKPPNPVPPKPIPQHLRRSACSLQGLSPPPVLSPGDHPHSWSSQSVPNLASSHQSVGQLAHPTMNQNQQSYGPGQTMFPSQNHSSQYLDQGLNSIPYPSTMIPQPHYSSPLYPYASLPNLIPHHSGLSGLQHSTTPPVHSHHSMTNLHQPFSAPHHVNLNLLHPGTPPLHSYPHQTPYPPTAHGQLCAAPYLSYQGCSNTLFAIPHQLPHYPPLVSDHTLFQSSLNPGLIPSQESMFGPAHSLHLGATLPSAPGSSQGQSSTELQLRRVLHEIRGTVQSLQEFPPDSPEAFSHHRTSSSHRQSLAEFQQKRRNLNLFRRQMMDVELSIMQQQAQVYHHLSPADRMEAEKLQALRSNVRDELAELEQQLEERLMEFIDNTKPRGLHRNASVDDLATISALRAMDPVSDLLNEQLFLQSELGYDDHNHLSDVSALSSSPVAAGMGGSEQKHKVFRTSVDITPVPPPRPNTQTQRAEGAMGGEKGEQDGEAVQDRRNNGELEKDGAPERVKVDNLQKLIQEIRDSVAQEIRQEIYSEILAAVTPQQPTSSTRQHPS